MYLIVFYVICYHFVSFCREKIIDLMSIEHVLAAIKTCYLARVYQPKLLQRLILKLGAAWISYVAISEQKESNMLAAGSCYISLFRQF